MARIHTVVLALSAVATIASGCGGSSKTRGTTTNATTTAAASTSPATPAATTTAAANSASGQPLTRAKWISEGETICTHTNTQIAPLSVKSIPDYGRVLPQMAIYYRTESIDLGKLVPPTSMAGDWAQIVNGLLLFSNELNKAGQYVQANSISVARQAFRAALGAQQQLVVVAKRDGFTQCAVVVPRRPHR